MRRYVLSMIVAIGLVTLAGNSSTASARPLSTPLSKVATKTMSVVIARYLGPVGTTQTYKAFQFRLDVIGMVRGPKRTGRIVVKLGTGHPDVKVGAVVVAFIDKNNEFSFVAEPPKGQSVQSSVLMVRGFYDFNAHLVWPSMLTLRQLEEYIDTQQLRYRFRGRVHVLDNRGKAVVPTTIRLRGSLDWRKQRVKVSGFPRYANNFPKTPKVRITPGWGAHISLIYRNHWPRPLKIGGTVTGVDPKTGELLVRFRITEPDLLTAKQLRRYLAHGKYSYPLWRYEIRLADGRRWAMTEHTYTARPRITTDKGHVYRYTSFSFSKGGAKQRNIELSGAKGAMRINFGPQVSGAFLDELGTTRRFRQELMHGPLACRIVKGEGKGQRCTITVRSKGFK